MLRISFSIKIACFIVLLCVLVMQVSRSCYSNYDCEDGRVCCRTINLCEYDCAGESCEFNSDCGQSISYCCDGFCQDGPCDLPVWAIIVCVILGIVIIVCVALCLYCLYCRQTTRFSLLQQSAVATMPGNHGTFASTQATTHGITHHQS